MYITIYPSGICKGHTEYPSEKVGVILKDGNIIENFGLIYPDWISAVLENYKEIEDICCVHKCTISSVLDR